MLPAVELEKPRVIEPANVRLDDSSVTVLTQTVAGSIEVRFLIIQAPPFLRGEDYPALVRVWDNDDDAVFDSL